MGLVDLAGVSARSFCGVGFSISGPPTVWRLEEANSVSLNGISGLDELAVNDISRIITVLTTRLNSGFTATLECSPLQHAGFGTKTSLLLSLITAINKLKRLNLSKAQIQKMSGRGGASGVGINLFFRGGIIWDGGHPSPDNLQFHPSSSSTNAIIPPLLARWRFPERWLISLIVPDTTRFSGAKELAFFRSNTPIAAKDALLTMSAIYHGVIPAFVTVDLDLLKSALEMVHSVGLKRAELLAQSRATRRTLKDLQALPRIAVGLSSLGPLIYCVFNGHDVESQNAVEEVSRRLGGRHLGTFHGRNEGFTVEIT